MKRLTPENARAVLARHDLVEEGEQVAVTPLSGGVSSVVLLCESPRRRVVLKQPQAEFATEDRWIVDTGRGKVEFSVGRFLARHLGRRVIPMIVYDNVDDILVLEAAPRGWRTWKERLLAGEVRPATAKSAGRLLAGIHALGADLDDPDAFREDALFREQRIDPYFVTAGERRPALAPVLDDLVATFSRRSDLVHGDFSPKNLFTDPAMEEVRLIDHEVTTRGDAAFDVGFLLTHLFLKAVHLPAYAEALFETARVFLATYQDARPDEDEDPIYAREGRALRWLGACLVARAVGKSRAEYLTGPELVRVEEAGMRILREGPGRLEDAIGIAQDAS